MSKIKELQTKCDEYLAGWKRAQADYANLQKETAQERSHLIKTANAGLLIEILPIYDHLKLAISHVPKDQRKLDWVIGIDHIKNQFAQFLASQGIEEIETIGQKFNPDIHEAVEQKNNQNIITKQVKPGYMLNGKILYPAKVVL